MTRSWSATTWSAGIITITLGFAAGTANAAVAARDSQQQPPARPPAAEQSAQPAATDLDFVSRVALSNMAAIQLGHMATKKAQHADVQKFAQATVDGYLKVQQQLADGASGAGVRWPTKLDDKYREIQQRLSKLDKSRFDREYMKAIVDWHHEIETMLAARVNSGGKDSRTARAPSDAKSDGAPLATKVDQWAARTLPGVRDRLQEAERVLGELGAAE